MVDLTRGSTNASITCPAEDFDMRRRRIRFRAWHRGTREMDLLMGRFADAKVAELSAPEIEDLEALMDVPDRDVFAWLTGAADVPGNYDTPVFRAVRAFHAHERPVHL